MFLRPHGVSSRSPFKILPISHSVNKVAASTAQLYQSNPQLLLNHHNSALEAAQGAAIRHEKLSKGHDEKSEANHISDDAAYNHQYAASDHEKISEQLKTNAAYHRKRIAEIKSGHHDAAGDYHEEFKKIRASRKLSADADEHAKHAENISKGMEGHEKAILSHKCKKSSPEYKACVDGRREAKRTYDSESEKASKHAATLKVGPL